MPAGEPKISDLDKLYLPRNEGRSGLTSIEDCVQLAIKGVHY